MSTATLTVKIDGRHAERDIKRLEKNLDKVAKKGTVVERQFAKMGNKAKIAAAGGLAALGVALIKSTKLAVAFQKSMAEISTLLSGDVEASMAELTAGVRELSVAYGGDVQTNSKALYSIISAGASDATEAVEILDVANKLAIGGVTDVATAADGLTSALNAYGAGADEAEAYSDSMFVAMKAGKTTIGELAGAMGNVAPMSSQLGVSFDELQASLAALTTTGLQTSVAGTQLQAMMSNILKPSQKAIKAANRLGLEFNSTALESKGLAGFLKDLQEKTKGNKDELGLLFKSTEAVKAVMSLTGAQAEVFAQTLDGMNKKAGATNEAFDKMKLTVDFEWNRLTAHFADLGITIGNQVLPHLENLLRNVNALFDYVDGTAVPSMDDLRKSMMEEADTALRMGHAIDAARKSFALHNITAQEASERIQRLTVAQNEARGRANELNNELLAQAAGFKSVADQTAQVDKDLAKFFATEGKVEKAVKKTTGAIDKQAEKTEAKKTETEKLTDRLVSLGVAERDVSAEMTDLQRAVDLGIMSEQAMFEATADLIGGFEAASTATTDLAATTVNEVGAMGKIWENFVDNTQKAFGDLIYKNMKSMLSDGKVTFKEFTDSILDMFLRMLAEMAAKWAAMKLFGGSGGGGIMGAFSGGGGGGASGGINIATGAAKAWGAAKAGYAGYQAAVAGGSGQLAAIGTGFKTMFGGAKAATGAVKLLGPAVTQVGNAGVMAAPQLGAVSTGAQAAGMSMQTMAGAATVAGAALVAAYIVVGGVMKSARQDAENSALTDHFNELRTSTDAFAGELYKVSEAVNIVGEAEGALYVAQQGTWEQRKEEIWRYQEALDATGVTLRTIHANNEEAVTMITGTAEQLAAASEVIKSGFDAAKVSLKSFTENGKNGMNTLTASFKGETKKWAKLFEEAMVSGELSADSSFAFIEDEFENTVLQMNGDATEWANFLASQGRLGANAMAETFKYIDDDGTAMFASLSDATMAFQQLMNSLTAPQLNGSINYSSSGATNPPGFATGGSFVVGGGGGTDTTPVSFMATRGEKVTVETPGQQSNSGDDESKGLMREMIRLLTEGNELSSEQVQSQEEIARQTGKQVATVGSY